MTTAPYGVTVIAGQAAVIIKLIAGGTLEIVNGSTPLPTGLGYPLTTNETISMDHSGTFWVCASGATCTIAVIQGRTSGNADV